VSRFPYVGLPEKQLWRRASLDPQGETRFKINRNSKIATGGSCFAQRIAERLQASGYQYFICETGPIYETPSWLQEHHYGTYTARYGDVYTTLQLLQLAQRAIGQFTPEEPAWRKGTAFFDPFRPRIQPEGFSSEEQMLEDRRDHLASVRRMFEQADVFIFTLGLTEVWCCSSDGAALPLCPGADYGTFDSDKYHFRNLTLGDNIAYLKQFLDIVNRLNPALRVILTVSPVPLAATMEPRHVVQSTVLSKSTLRLAADEIRCQYPNVDYFASYEIVNGTFSSAPGFEPDGRTVTAEAVDRVMLSFFAHFVEQERHDHVLMGPVTAAPVAVPNDPCDEVFLLQYISKNE
jgi:hypothetical protein